MNKSQISYRSSASRVRTQLFTSGNALGILHTESLWDKNRKQIVYIIKTKQMVHGDINVLLEDQQMTLEAHMDSSGKKNRNETEEGLTLAGFSEFRLKPGYQYALLSSQVINPNLIKVVLGFKPESVYRNN